RSGVEEAFGMVYIEAQAVAKPVVAFDSGGVSEAVSHGQTGLLAPERDWQALAGYLVALLENTELRRRFGAAGRERVVREFDLEKRTRILEGIYAEISGRKVHTASHVHAPDPKPVPDPVAHCGSVDQPSVRS